MKKVWIASIFATLMLGLACCGCLESVPEDTIPGGKPISLKEQVSAGEAGNFTSTDGRLVLEIPAGALPEDTEILINEISEDEWPKAIKDLEPEGPVLRLEPDGVEFSKPVTITLQADPSKFVGNESEDGIPAYALTSVNKSGEQEYVNDTETHVHSDGSITVSGNLSHFSWIVRYKFSLRVKLEKQDKEREVDEKFEVGWELKNEAPPKPVQLVEALSCCMCSGPLEFAGELSGEPSDTIIALDVRKLYPGETEEYPAYLDFKGTKPGTGVYTLVICAGEVNEDLPIWEQNVRMYRVVLDSLVKIVKRTYCVVESRGIYMETFATQEEVASFSWRFESKAGKLPSTSKFACVTPTKLPDRFREKYDSGEAIVERENLDKKADNLYIPFDEEGQISFSLRTQIPGEYAFEICGILLENYTDDESYEGDGDEIVVVVPEPPEVSSLQRECEEVSVAGLGPDTKAFICKWHLFANESEIISWDEIGDMPYGVLTAPDGSNYSGLFLIIENRSMVEGHPWMPGQYEGTAEHYRYVTFKYGCSHLLGSHVGECGYGQDGILYFTVLLMRWETVTVSIGDVAEEWFTYSGKGDPITITRRSEDEPITITYSD